MMKSIDRSPGEHREDIALLWVSRLASGGKNQALDEGVLSDLECTELRAWLDADALNAQAYESARQLWQLTALPSNKAARAERDVLQNYLARPRHRRSRTRPLVLAASVAAIVLSALALALLRPENWLDDMRADHVSRPGQVEALVLADGSEVRLDGNSAISVSLNDTERKVRLLRGAAYFHVVHDGRPFSVETTQGEVRVLGTRFEVRQAAADDQVAVEHGRVAVMARDASQQILTDNQAVHLTQAGVTVLRDILPEQTFGWQNGRLNFRKTPLADVLETLERYSANRLVLLNHELATRPVSGDFSSGDPQAVLTALQPVLGFSMWSLPGGTVVIR